MKIKRRRLLWLLLLSWVLLMVLLIPHVIHLNQRVVAQFEGKRWELPAHVYAQSMDLFGGKPLSAKQLRKILSWLNYVEVKQPQKAGEYSRKGSRVEIVTRGFRFPDEYQASQHIVLRFKGKAITDIQDAETGKPVSLFRLEPVRIANIYPKHNEDRRLVKLENVPPLLVAALLAVEDQDFYQHHGLKPTSIIRAGLANMRAGRTVQGGSTLTQQLVKNFFLSNERSLHRKLNEAIMSLLLEWHYDKNEILEAYLNEIYLGQDGNRSIHGFGLASQFYYQRELNELEPQQLVLLAALAKGASYFAPRRHPERAKERRNLVIDLLVEAQLLDTGQAEVLKGKPLGVSPKAPSGITAYPAFLQMVRKQLRKQYKDEDLQSEGLRVFTTFDPLIQAQAEQAVTRQLKRLEKERGIEPDSLQAALMVASVEQGEVLAVVGGRNPRFAGFNRALEMKRPIGSAIKPAVYLTALSHPEKYNLVSLLDDSELVVTLKTGDWMPSNYDHSFHEGTNLSESLIHSYNIATVRLGLDLGLDHVIQTLRALGVESPLNPFPSLLLGAAELPPVELLQMYQTIAAGGYRSELRAILAVVNQSGETLQRYPLTVEQAVSADADFLLTKILQEVAVSGTARALGYLLPGGLEVAGKTGTTNDLRDSWFAGFSGEHVAVAWVGRDDNKSTGLTGSSGALRVWADVFKDLQTQPLEPSQPDDIEWAMVDIKTGALIPAGCSGGSWVPFIAGSWVATLEDCPEDSAVPEAGAGDLFDPETTEIDTSRGIMQ